MDQATDFGSSDRMLAQGENTTSPTKTTQTVANGRAETMPDVPQGLAGTKAVAERRARTRVKSTSMILVKLADENGGVASDITEDGLTLVAAMPLHSAKLFSLHIRLPGSKDWIEVWGQFVWKSESRRRAGVRFVDQSEKAREQIRSWIASETSGDTISTQASVAPPEEMRPEEAKQTCTIRDATPEAVPVVAHARADGARTWAQPGEVWEAR